MTDKVQKIREEVERLKSNLVHGACASQIAMETRCKEEAYDEVISLLDSLQEEPVSEGYHQAEKDLELTIEDIKTIDKLLNQCVDYSNPYQEVLKRFNKEGKEK